MTDISIAVVIVLQNNGEAVERALKSVKNQYTPVDEIIVVDNESTGRGVDVVRTCNMDKVTLLTQPNSSLAAARNFGAYVAKSKYVAFLDSNDEWLPFFTNEFKRLLIRFPAHAAYATRYQFINANKVPVDAKIKLSNHNPNGVNMQDYFTIAAKGELPFSLSSFIVHKAFFLSIGGFEVNDAIGDEPGLFAKITSNNDIAYSPNIHAHIHTDTTTRETKAIPPFIAPFAERLYKKALRGSFSPYIAADVKRYCAKHALSVAKTSIKEKQFANALSVLQSPMSQFLFFRYLPLKIIATYSYAISLFSSAKSLPKREVNS